MRSSVVFSAVAFFSACTLLTFALLSPNLRTSSDNPLPLVLWHGLGDKFDNEGLQHAAELAERVNPGTYVYIIRLHPDAGTDQRATYFGDLTQQVDDVCKAIAEDPILASAPGINGLAFSQGGQFLRAYVQRCNNPPMRNLVTMGSQHNGIQEFSKCKPGDWLCLGAFALLKSNVWSDFVQKGLVPAQYYRNVDETSGEPSQEYVEHSNFLADINNEREVKNQTYKKNLASLDNFAMYMFGEDTVVVPKETAFFGQVTNMTSGEVTNVKKRAIYKEDWIGLRSLDEHGRLKFRTLPGEEHMHLSDEDLVSVYREFFSPPTLWQKFRHGFELR